MNTKPNRDITAEILKGLAPLVDDVADPFYEEDSRAYEMLKTNIFILLNKALTKQKEEIVKQVITALTTDISNSEFIGDARREWEVLPDRGVEPCLECSNGFNIRKLLSMFQNELK